jgi:hypothetical protein
MTPSSQRALAPAVGQSMTVTAEHHGRIIADIVAMWATLHTDPQ